MQISDMPNTTEEDGECFPFAARSNNRRAPIALLHRGLWRMLRFFVSMLAGFLLQIYKKLAQICNIFKCWRNTIVKQLRSNEWCFVTIKVFSHSKKHGGGRSNFEFISIGRVALTVVTARQSQYVRLLCELCWKDETLIHGSSQLWGVSGKWFHRTVDPVPTNKQIIWALKKKKKEKKVRNVPFATHLNYHLMWVYKLFAIYMGALFLNWSVFIGHIFYSQILRLHLLIYISCSFCNKSWFKWHKITWNA